MTPTGHSARPPLLAAPAERGQRLPPPSPAREQGLGATHSEPGRLSWRPGKCNATASGSPGDKWEGARPGLAVAPTRGPAERASARRGHGTAVSSEHRT